MEDRYLFRAKRLDNGEWVQGALLIAILERCARNAITSMMQNTGQRRGERWVREAGRSVRYD